MPLRYAFHIAVILAFLAFKSPAQTPAPPPTTKPALSQAELEKNFEKTMTNAVLAGSFTMGDSDKPPARDKYTLGKVTKKQGDVWIFVATIQYGTHNISVPLEIPVKWAGDTAVISVTDVGVAALGKYTARVMIYGDEYVGIWGSSDGSHGGKMWGRIEHPTTQPK